MLKNPAFNADEVDTDMLKRLQASIDSGDIQIINMTVEGDGDQVLELFKRQVEMVLRELMADMRLAGHQHFAFHEYKDPRGNRLFAGHSNGFLQGTPTSWGSPRSRAAFGLHQSSMQSSLEISLEETMATCTRLVVSNGSVNFLMADPRHDAIRLTLMAIVSITRTHRYP